jgi:hypothetical protein
VWGESRVPGSATPLAPDANSSRTRLRQPSSLELVAHLQGDPEQSFATAIGSLLAALDGNAR